MPLRILHLSDIHFHDPVSGWDEDADLRNELIRDLKQLVTETGAIDAVLIGGDIAFSASPDEYEIALNWIDEILEAAGGLERSRVWTVPGNHDVRRASVSSSPIAQEFRTALRECNTSSIDVELRKRLSVDSAGNSVLLNPLKEYNEFANRFACASSADEPSWFDESLEVDGWHVRLTGLNSVLVSDETDDHNGNANLVVGCHQCRLPRKDRLINVVMIHHPPEWLRDWTTIEPYLQRAELWLFGHEHAFKATQTTAGVVKVAAGAVAPERDEGGERGPFLPSYNLLELSVRADSTLVVEINPRFWSLERTAFQQHPDGKSVFEISLEPDHESDVEQSIEEDEVMVIEENSAPATPLAEELPSHVNATEIAAPTGIGRLRDLTVKYLSLPVSRKRAIGRELHVLTDDDLAEIGSAKLYTTLLIRIRDRGLIDELEGKLL